MIPSPAGADALAPFLAAGADGRVLLAWTARAGDGTAAVRFAAFDGTGFGAVRTVIERAPLFVNWADYASVVPLGGDTVAAHWLQVNGGSTYSYAVHVAHSADGGATWGRPRILHDDTAPVEHGFVTLWREDDGALGAAWLDGRKTAQPDSTPEMTVRVRRVRADGTAEPEAVADPRSCDCCQTAVARVRDGLLVAYRDRTTDEVRDIAVVRRTAAGWSEPSIVHADGWVTKACPVNGPGLDARGDTVAIAWFTAARDTAKVLAAFSTDGGTTFGAPIRVDAGQPIGRVSLVLDDRGDAVVAWHETVSADSAEVRVKRIRPDGTASRGRTVAHLAATRRAGVTRMVRHGDALVFAWTVAGDHPTVAVATAPLEAK